MPEKNIKAAYLRSGGQRLFYSQYQSGGHSGHAADAIQYTNRPRAAERTGREPDISVQGNVLNGINSSVSLKASVSGLRDTKDELAQLLADIINEIY